MSNSAREIAQKFVSARREGKPLADYPGDKPTELAGAYQVQEQAIGLFGEEIVGWKIGRVPPDLQATYQAERMVGPIFKSAFLRAPSAAPVQFSVIEGGFGAVEAEYVFRMGADAPAGKTEWTPEEALGLVAALHVGIETAGSPLGAINKIGPIAVVSDFGNNNGLILGPEIPDWRKYSDEDLRVETSIDGKSVGRGSAASIPEGPLAALVFLLGHLGARNRPLKTGQLISTGAATGIHDILVGQTARISFAPFAEINCAAVKAMPREMAPR